MSDKHLHIVSFDIPYPPNYGGVIDVFYKIRTLHSLGIKIYLHCIEYPGRDRSPELDKYCHEVNYYPRKTGLLSALSLVPYIVRSRKSEKLISRLLEDDYPILFEGMHTCYYLNHKDLRSRFKIYRESNIEHRYYFNLFKVDKKIRNKMYFLIASLKLKLFQRQLRHANLMLAVSQKDTDYLQGRFANNRIVHLPSFHANNIVKTLNGKGTYTLYHGNIEVPENEYAAKFLINNVFDDQEMKLVVAGMNPPESVRKLIEERENAELIANPDDSEMFNLIKNAHVNILVTFQATGLKLKLLNTLYNGRFCLVNNEMIQGTVLGDLCEVGNTASELKSKLRHLFTQEFNHTEQERRQRILRTNYDNHVNGEKLIGLIW